MGNTPIQIGLKCDKQTYHSGETMTGTVYVSVSSITPAIQQYQGIRLALDGHETTEVRIRESKGDNSTRIRTERESTSLLHIEVPLTMFASPLRVAKYEFPFEWKLPSSQLPSSFKHRNAGVDGKGFCEVRYTLSAFLVPQAQQSGLFGGNGIGMGSTNRSGTYTSQTIQLVGAPTRDIPEPLHIAEERTVMNGLCCCWKQGHVSLGWETDSIVLAPNATCQMQLWGSNTSNLDVHGLRIQLLQTVEWQAGHEYSQRHSRKDTTTLVDYKVDVSHLPQWDPLVSQGNNQNSYAAVTQQQQGNQPVPTTFQVPPDVLDSYQGMHCKIEHQLVVTAVTRLLATTPTVSYKVHLQRYDHGTTTNTASMPVATAWMEESEFQDVVLPPDWSPDEKVPVIVLEQVQTVDDDDDDYNTQNAKAVTMATARAVMVEPVMASSATASGIATPAVAPFGHSNNHNDTMMGAASAAAADPFAYRDDPTDDPLAFARPSAPPMEMDTTGTK